MEDISLSMKILILIAGAMAYIIWIKEFRGRWCKTCGAYQYTRFGEMLDGRQIWSCPEGNKPCEEVMCRCNGLYSEMKCKRCDAILYYSEVDCSLT